MRVDETELRDLERRAYGAGGALTAADAVRLRTLQEERRASRSDAAPTASDVETSPRRNKDNGSGEGHLAAESPSDGASSLPDEAAGASTGWRRWVLATALLLVGAGGGWFAATLLGGGPPLSSEQRERHAVIAADPVVAAGTLELIREVDGMMVWFAGRADSDDLCIALDADGQYQLSCGTRDRYEREGLSVMLPAAGTGGTAHNAVIVPSLSGEPLAYVFSFTISGGDGWLEQFSSEEQPVAESLLAEGYDLYSPTVIGTFEGEAVWWATRDVGVQTCLIVPGINGGAACGETAQAHTDGIVFVLLPGEPDGQTRANIFRLDFHDRRGPTLTMESRPVFGERGEAASGLRIDLDSQTGQVRCVDCASR